MYEDQISQLYQNLLGRAPDPGGLASYSAAAKSGMSMADIQSSIANSPEAARYRAAQQAQPQKSQIDTGALLSGFTTQINDLRTAMQNQMKAQQQALQEAQRKYQEDMQRMQQTQLETETRQAAGQQSAQVAGPGKSMIIRPGGSTRFSRPELQIKGMNI